MWSVNEYQHLQVRTKAMLRQERNTHIVSGNVLSPAHIPAPKGRNPRSDMRGTPLGAGVNVVKALFDGINIFFNSLERSAIFAHYVRRII
jgi:hypothetical protein